MQIDPFCTKGMNYFIENINMNMTFISSSEVKNIHFISGECKKHQTVPFVLTKKLHTHS